MIEIVCILPFCKQLSKGATYDLSICPEDGLAAQNYRCADCKIAISFSKLHTINCSSKANSFPVHKENSSCLNSKDTEYQPWIEFGDSFSLYRC